MKKLLLFTFISGFLICCTGFLSNGFSATGAEQPVTYTVTIDQPVNGNLTLSPALPADGIYPEGTVVTVTAKPDAGYAFDAGYYSVPGRFGQMYTEFATPTFTVTIDQDKHIGASFIEASALEGFTVKHDIVFAKPGVKTLKYDVFTPDGAKNLPCIVIIHGGGWSANSEDIMRGLARELVRDGKYVVVSIDYRWAGQLDGDETGNTMANLIEDCYGAIVHIMEHAAEYGADPDKIAVTGDSAGGHLSAAVAVMAHKIGDGGFGKTPGVFEYMPSYVPAGKSIDQVRAEVMSAIKAAAPSYGVFAGLNTYTDDPAADSTWTQAVSPINNIPNAADRAVPHYLTRGSRDGLIRHEMVQTYLDALVAAGHRAEYIQVGGAGHAFFDWKPNEQTKATFKKYGVYYAAQMQLFYDSVFYPERL
ncbi:MAG: alpha/beta hydrolase [Bacteroidales bacterium]|nr:alpha/beta hydrolase [Bacteroidales bacterium]